MVRFPNIAWISRDAWLIIAARGTHGFYQGFLSVALGVYLLLIGFSLTLVGFYLAIGLAGAAVFSTLAGLLSEWVGRRVLMVLFAALAAATGAALAITEHVIPLMAFAFLGSLNSAPGGPSPTTPLEQAGLAGSAVPNKRTELFAVYRITGTSAAAIGSLAAGLPELFQALFGMSDIASFKWSFGLFAGFRAVGVIAFALLSPSIEVAPGGRRRFTNPFTLPSRRHIFILGGLFSVDNFGGALIVHSLLAVWFTERFGLDIGSIATVFFAMHVLGAVSLWLSAKLSNRLGLVNVMVSSQIASAVLLIAAAFSPTAWLAIVLLLVRALVNQMDIAPRDALMMTIVGPEERVAIGSVHLVGRNVLSTAAPPVATSLWNAISAAAPLVASSVVKISYDVVLWSMYRNVRPYDETHPTLPAASPPERP